MKVNLLETHDRLQHLQKDQANTIAKGADECRTKNKNSIEMQEYFPYIYIFAHPRTAEDGVTKRMLWQPRLTKPKAQTNSYLFRVISKTDLVEIIWILPPRELWKQFETGNILESRDILTSIHNFENYRDELERPHEDDLSENEIRKILESIQDKNLVITL